MKLFINTYWYILILSLPTQIFTASQSNRLAWLIDDIECESLRSESLQAETAELDLIIKEQEVPAIVSRNLLLNYVARRSFIDHPKHPENLELKGSPFYRGIWRVFKIRGTAYYLLIPQKYLVAKKASLENHPQGTNLLLGLHFHMTIEITTMLPASGDFYRDLRRYLITDKDTATLAVIDLSQIFITQDAHKSTSSSWVFYMTGHGSREKYTVGTKVETICKLLAFFDTAIQTKLVYLSSCFLGGPIKHNLIRKKPYRFMLVVGSITDSSVSFQPNMSLVDFFKEAEALSPVSTQEALAQACCHLAPCEESISSSHGVLEYPQVLVAGNFRALDIRGKVANLEQSTPSPKKFLEKSGEDDNEEEEVSTHPVNKIAFLLYDQDYIKPIDVSPTHCFKTSSGRSTPLSFVPCTAKLVAKAFFTDTKAYAHFGYTQPLVNPFFDPKKSASQNCAHILDNLAPKTALFPLFISMHHPKICRDDAPSVHRFAQVNVHNEIDDEESPFFGVQRFLRDAFFDTSERASKNVFLFDEINGFNDFSLFADLFTESNSTFQPPCGTRLLKPLNTFLTLENVIIVTQGRLGSSRDEMSINISFTLEGASWHYYFFGKPNEIGRKNPWCFAPKDINAYVIHYTQCVAGKKENYVYKIKTYADAVSSL